MPIYISQSLPDTGCGWHTPPSTPELSSPGAGLPVPQRLLPIQSRYFDYLLSFCTFVLLAAVLPVLSLPSPSRHMVQGHDHSRLSQMCLPLAMFSYAFPAHIGAVTSFPFCFFFHSSTRMYQILALSQGARLRVKKSTYGKILRPSPHSQRFQGITVPQKTKWG